MGKKNPSYVTRQFCDERFDRIIDKLDVIDEKIDGIKSERKEETRDWRALGFAVLGSVTSGIIVAAITTFLT
ncbi:MAG: hypothetical protein ACE5L6_02010 [Candidatus Bathyarchaeia archaeon]